MANDKNGRGILLMLASMAAFALADTLVKIASASLTPAQISFFLLGGGLIVFTTMALVQGEKLRDIRAFQPVLMLRYLAEIVGMVGMITALAYVPLSTVGAITQATPIFVTIGAVFFLRETVNWRRWSAIIIGFIGVLFVVQPGTDGFDSSVLWAVLAMVALALRDLTTRMVPADMPSTCLAAYTMIAATPVTIAWVLLSGETLFPSNINWLVVIPMIGLGSVGYMLLIASLRMAEVSVVMPFRYSRIIFLLGFGILVFDEKPTVLMLSGAALIIASGIYMMWREHRLKIADL
jgi:drug/metabolite transporter (DMT)-like permease